MHKGGPLSHKQGGLIHQIGVLLGGDLLAGFSDLGQQGEIVHTKHLKHPSVFLEWLNLTGIKALLPYDFALKRESHNLLIEIIKMK